MGRILGNDVKSDGQVPYQTSNMSLRYWTLADHYIVIPRGIRRSHVGHMAQQLGPIDCN